MIARGKRPDYDKQRQEALSRQDTEEVLAAGPVERCPGCGRLIQMPCRACLVPAIRAAPRALPADGDCRLDLGDGARARYEEMRRRREMIDAAE